MKDEDESRCRYGGRLKENRNCEHPAEDGLAVQSVGAWVEKKHEHLRLYIEATRAVTIFHGDCNAEIDRIVAAVPPLGLNIALIDPFAPSALKWTTIAKLGAMRRMDLLIHFPTGPIKRNLLHPGFDRTIDEMLGTGDWRSTVRAADEVPKLIDCLRVQLAGIGYEGERVNTLPVATDKNLLLYHLVFASKDRRGTKIWQSITRHDGAQRGWGF